MVIDNLFTPEDCARYVATAEASKDWDAAAINVGPGPQGQVRVFYWFQTSPQLTMSTSL